LGFFASTYGLGTTNTLFLVAGLNFAAFILSAILVSDPPMIFERSLVSIEKSVDFASHGVFLASKMIDGTALNERLKKENVAAFCCGLVLFSLATNILFTPLPVFVSNITNGLQAATALVFAVFALSSAGAIAGYYSVGRTPGESSGKGSLSRLVLGRALFAFVLLAALRASLFNVLLATGVLVFMGFLFAVFMIHIFSLSMEFIPAGKAGLINVLIGVGAAFGSFIGPFIAQALGFFHVFVVAGIIFFIAFAFFEIFA
jgi:MFS family permease